MPDVVGSLGTGNNIGAHLQKSSTVVPAALLRCSQTTRLGMARPAGLEPATPGLEALPSDRLYQDGYILRSIDGCEWRY
jgi:hypothetical protein